MSTKYWDIYVLYIERCVRENYINDIDPNHYRMEWNHFWPQCVAGDWPVGQWLTLKQHAIASALQTLAFRENCMHGKHKSYIPAKLLELAWPFFCEASSEKIRKVNEITHAKKDENGKSIHTMEIIRKLHADKSPSGKSLAALKASSGKMKPVKVTFPDKSERTFQSIRETAEFFNAGHASIHKRIIKGPSSVPGSKLYGLSFDLAE